MAQTPYVLPYDCVLCHHIYIHNYTGRDYAIPVSLHGKVPLRGTRATSTGTIQVDQVLVLYMYEMLTPLYRINHSIKWYGGTIIL